MIIELGLGAGLEPDPQLGVLTGAPQINLGDTIIVDDLNRLHADISNMRYPFRYGR